jgi:hypothetical protein
VGEVSIRNTPRHTVMVQRRRRVKGSAGQGEFENDGLPVTVRGNVHPVSTSETIDYGLQGTDLRRLHCLNWPGDSRSNVTFDGASWDVAAPPQHFDMSPSTAHWEVLLRKKATS